MATLKGILNKGAKLGKGAFDVVAGVTQAGIDIAGGPKNIAENEKTFLGDLMGASNAGDVFKAINKKAAGALKSMEAPKNPLKGATDEDIEKEAKKRKLF